MSETLPANQSGFPEAWVDKLFQRFAAMYGKHWFDQWAQVPMDDVKAAWRKDLARVSGDQIRKALDHCKSHNPFPPTSPEFIGLCKAFAPSLQFPELPPPRGGEIPPEIRSEIAKFLTATDKRDPKDWARQILTLHAEGNYTYPEYGVECAKRALGLIA